MSFPNKVTVLQPPGLAGTYCDKTPRASVVAGPFGLVAGPSLYVARFAWTTGPLDWDGTPSVANSFGSGPPAGLCMNLHDSVIRDVFSETSDQVLPGYAVTLQKAGGFWWLNSGNTLAVKGMFAFANFADGTASFGAPGSGSSAAVTGSVAASTAAVTGSIAGDMMNVTGVTSGVVVPGANVAGAGVSAGTQVLKQISGTNGGVGIYEVSGQNQSVPAATALALTYGTLTVSAVGSGVVGVGDSISGGTMAAEQTINARGTGTGGMGTYFISSNAVIASAALTVGTSIQTKWIAMSTAAPGEILKMTNHTEG